MTLGVHQPYKMAHTPSEGYAPFAFQTSLNKKVYGCKLKKIVEFLKKSLKILVFQIISRSCKY